MDRRFFWTKVWGALDVPAHDALALNHKSIRDDALAAILPGDIVVYLTSDATEASPMMRGRVRMLEAAVFETLANQHQFELSKPSQFLKVFGRPIITAIRTQRSIGEYGLMH